MVGGYAGKILEVDLAKEQVRRTPLDLDMARKFVGGRGMMNKLLWDMIKPGTDPLGPDNLLMIFTGPITGLLAGNQTVLRFKSPLTATSTGLNLMGHAVTGGQFAPELKFAGYDGVIISGRAEEPVYLNVRDDDVEIRDADHLWGKTAIETEVKIKEETDPFTRVLSIGPAGENLVKYASVEQEYFRAAARCGSGTVMGSKNLKAVAARGTQGITLEDPEECFRIEKEGLRRMSEPEASYSRRRWGTTLAGISVSDRSYGPLKNWRETYWGDEVEKAGGLQWESRCRVKNRSCYGCAYTCMQIGVIRSGPYAGTVDSPDYDSTELLGPNCMVTDPDGMYALSAFCDEYGFDAISLGNVLSWAMECYEKGILTREDLGGVDLTWGNVPAMFELSRKILHREGVGDLLAEGVRIASEKVGRGTEKFAMHCKGIEWGVGGTGNNRDNRECYCYVMSDHGGVHKYGTTLEGQNTTAMYDSLTHCSFQRGAFGWELPSKMLNAATGWDMVESQEDWDNYAWRIIILERAWNIREGLRPDRDDVLPDRVHEEPLTLGPKAGTPAAIYPREQFEADKQEWYEARGCDEHGIPTKETLKKLGLEFVITDLQKLGVLG